MREQVRDRDRLEHIIDAINIILNFTYGKAKEEMECDKLKFYGIVKNIEIIGEAAYKLTHAFRNRHPETPWEFIAKMRHVLVHDYYHIDAAQVWIVVQNDLKPLHDQVTRYLAETNWEEWEKNEVAIVESAVNKSNTQMARHMKIDGIDAKQISRYTGLSVEDVENL